MKPENKNLEQKKCGEGCGCATNAEKFTDQKNLKVVEEKKSEEQKLDPTHFGDWQVNCRTIDF
jgi:hypothetical protein